MNILPLILALLLMLSALTVERLEKHKNQVSIQKQYNNFIEDIEREYFNNRQRRLFQEKLRKDIMQLSFRYLYDKEARNNNSSAAQSYRMLNIELMKIVYAEAPFYKNLVEKRPQFVEELVEQIENISETLPSGAFKRIEDISRLQLEDPELQEAFYHMLKGTISRKRIKEKDSEELKKIQLEKAYVSLFEFINNNGSNSNTTPQIEIQHSPYEILKAIFVDDDVVKQVIEKRKEIAANGTSATIENDFIGKIRTGLDSKIFDFKITKNADLSEYE